MSGKDKVRLGIPERKSKTFQLLLRPLSRLDHLCNSFLKIGLILERCHTECHRKSRHRIAVVGITDIIHCFDQLRITHRISDTHAGKRTRLGVGLHDQHIVVFLRQLQRRAFTKVRICLINDDHHITVMLDDITQKIYILQHTGRCIRIGNNNTTVFFIIILPDQIKMLIQRRSLIRNLKQLCPHIVE